MKRLLKLVVACCWLPVVLLREEAGRVSGRGRRLTILYYHAVPPAARDNFAQQIAYLHRHFAIVWADRRERLDRGRPAVAVTFDDAFRSVREVALPVLREYAVSATIFVPLGYLGKRPGWEIEGYRDRDEIIMTAEELRALPGDLVRLGSHTVTHPRLSRLGKNDLNSELAGSKAGLERMLGTPVDTLAFPHGDHDDVTLRVCMDTGYRTVYSVMPEAISTTSDRLLRGRTAVEPSDSLFEFALKARGAYSWMPVASKIKRALMTASLHRVSVRTK